MNTVTNESAFVNSAQSEHLYQKPAFTQPSMYKMDDFEDDMLSCDEMLDTEEFSCKPVTQGQSLEANKLSLVATDMSRSDKIANSVELPILPGVKKGIWRSVSYTIYREVEEVSEKSTDAKVEEQPAEAEESSEEQDEDIEEIVAEMQQLLKNQKKSKAKKYADIIRESVEFTLDDEEEFDDSYEKKQLE